MSLSERRNATSRRIVLPEIDYDQDVIPMQNLKHPPPPPPEVVVTADVDDPSPPGSSSRATTASGSPLLTQRRPRTSIFDIAVDMIDVLPSHTTTPLTPGISPAWMRTQRKVRGTGSASAIGASTSFLTTRKPGSRESVDNYAAEIADVFEKDDVLMDDTPESEQLRLDTLRDMTETLNLKRNVKKRISRTVSLNSQKAPPGASKRFRYRIRATLAKMRAGARQTVSGLEIWYNTIKEIEGKFGSGVATYFRFLRTLLLLNCFVLVISFAFLVIPQLLERYYINVNSTESGDWSFKPRPNPYGNNSDFQFGNLITGEGWLTNTELYYGVYSNVSISLAMDYYYNIPSAYFFTTFFCYLFCVIALSISMARSYRKNFIEMQGGFTNVYAHKIFCGWDFSIVSTEAAQLRSQNIYNELRELLHEEAQAEKIASSPKSLSEKCSLLGTRVGITLLVVSLLIGSGVLVWFLLQEQTLDEMNSDDEEKQKAEMMMSLVVTCVMLVLPMIFSRLASLERYPNPRDAVYVTLLRTFGLEVAIVGVLLAFWLRKAPNSSCWETSLGQEVYRLIIVDFLICLIGTSMAEFIRARLHRSFWPGLGAPQFDIARNTLNLIYNQTLFWVGFYFSPALSVVIVIKMLLTFYIKKFCVLYNCQPSPRSWRAAQTQTVFVVLTFLAIVGVLITLGYVITQVPTSECGPFNDFDYTYEKILVYIFQMEVDSTFWRIVMFFTKPGVVAFIIVALCVVVYYMRAVASARGAMVELLRSMLVLEAEDKLFLQDSIRHATTGHWQHHSPSLRRVNSKRLQVRFQSPRKSSM